MLHRDSTLHLYLNQLLGMKWRFGLFLALEEDTVPQDQQLHTNVLSIVYLIPSDSANMLKIHHFILQLLSSQYVVPGQVSFIQVRPSTIIIFGLIITWGPPSGSNYPTPVTYRLRYRERPSSGLPGGWSSVETATQRQYTTPVLKPGTRYEVEVWAFVSRRSGPSSARFGITGELQIGV